MAKTVRLTDPSCSCCRTSNSELGIHYFNSDELLCGRCEIKKVRSRR